MAYPMDYPMDYPMVIIRFHVGWFIRMSRHTTDPTGCLGAGGKHCTAGWTAGIVREQLAPLGRRDAGLGMCSTQKNGGNLMNLMRVLYEIYVEDRFLDMSWHFLGGARLRGCVDLRGAYATSLRIHSFAGYPPLVNLLSGSLLWLRGSTMFNRTKTLTFWYKMLQPY